MTIIPDWNTLTGPEKDAIIRPLWDDGVSAGIIALEHFRNASRNMIIGRIFRGKMAARKPHQTLRPAPKTKPPKPPKPKPEPKPKKPKSPMSVVSSSAFVAIANPDPPDISIMHMIENNRPPLPGTVPVPMEKLPNRPGVMCRFPVDYEGRMMYCGAPCGDKTYCADHGKMAYRDMPKEIVIGKNKGHNRA